MDNELKREIILEHFQNPVNKEEVLDKKYNKNNKMENRLIFIEKIGK